MGWRTNKYKKQKSWRQIEGGHIKPRVKKCTKCKIRRVIHHHFLCDRCYFKLNGRY